MSDKPEYQREENGPLRTVLHLTCTCDGDVFLHKSGTQTTSPQWDGICESCGYLWELRERGE